MSILAKAFAVTFFFFSLLFLAGGILVFDKGEYSVSIIFFIVLIILVWAGVSLWKYKPKQKVSKTKAPAVAKEEAKSSVETKEEGISLANEGDYNYEAREERRVANANYFAMGVHNRAKQTMESMEIISESKNFDTVQSRYQFVQETLNELKGYAYHPRYIQDVQIGVDYYKQLYYDRLPTDVMIAGVVDPVKFDLETFYCASLENCYYRYRESQFVQISALKREDAKNKRFAKLNEILGLVMKEMAQNCKAAKNFNEVYSRLVQAQDELSKKIN